MKSSMNQIQKNYLAAKAAADAINSIVAEKELKFLQDKGRNETHVWLIEDEAVFDSLNAEFSATVEDLESDQEAARLALKEAENDLIEYALSIAPADIRGTLRRGSDKRMSVREELIETILKLDVSTIPE